MYLSQLQAFIKVADVKSDFNSERHFGDLFDYVFFLFLNFRPTA